jgi:hypothetical protein
MSIQNGLIQTALTYPTGRRMLLLVKSLLVVLTCGLITTLVSVVASYTLIPGSKDLATIFSSIAAIWVYVMFAVFTTALIAILSKSAAVTAVGGAGIQFGFLLIGMSTQIPSVHVFFSPVTAVSEFVLGNAAIQVTAYEIVAMVGALLCISLVLLIASVALFERMDV